MKTLKNSRYRRPALFWGSLILILVVLSLLSKVIGGLKNSAVSRLSRVNIKHECKNGETIISLEEKSAVFYKIPEDLKPLPLPVLGGITGVNGTDLAGAGKIDLRRLFWQAFRNRLKTDLSKYDLFLLLIKDFRLKNDRIKMIEGKPELAKSFKDSRVRSESLSVAVVNSTKHIGLAQFASTLIENCGGRVIKVADSEENILGCRVVTRENNRSYTRTWLSLVFGCEEQYAPNDGRADLTLILGEEYWKKISQ